MSKLKEWFSEKRGLGFREFLILAFVGVMLGLFAGGARAAELEVKAPATVWETYVFPAAGEGALSISDQPCSVPSAMEEWENIRVQVRARRNTDIGEAKQSRLLWHGQVYAGCYVIGPDNERVYNIDSTGEMLKPPIPRELFKPHEGVAPPQGQET